MRAVVSVLKHSRDSEVANFNLATLSHEDVLSLKVAMQDLSVVDVLNCKGHLDEPIQDLVFTVADCTETSKR